MGTKTIQTGSPPGTGVASGGHPGAHEAGCRQLAATDQKGEVTRLLAALAQGDREAFDQLFPLVYDTLRAIARRQLRPERAVHTLATTDIVHHVECRFFAGMSIEDTAVALEVSPATVKRTGWLPAPGCTVS